jgi:DNA helicase-2/ATP-dependent DNA helicase PcrA
MSNKSAADTSASPDDAEALPWLKNVRGKQVIPIITSNDPIIRVNAGPGTGKTFGLQRRVLRLLHGEGENVDGKEILVVAFNRVIAKELKETIEKEIEGLPHRGEPIIQTIHAFCLRIIGGKIRILLPHERDAMLYDILAKHKNLNVEFQKIAKARKSIVINTIEKALSDHEAGQFSEDIDQTLYTTLWQATREWLTRHDSRLISELPKLLENRIKAGDFDETKYKHVIVDEFQDLTPVLQKLFFDLRSSDGHFLALGDPNQSIYSFLGNDREGLDKITGFATGIGEPILDVPMSECQRCPETIVNASNQLMALAPSPPMTSVSTKTADIHIVTWPTVGQEAKGMAAKVIGPNIKKFPKDTHLIMVTRRKFGYLIRDELSKFDSSMIVDMSFSESLLETWSVREAFLFFSLLADPDAPTWRAWFSYKNSPDGTKDSARAGQRNAPAYLTFLTDSKDDITALKVKHLANDGKAPKGAGGSYVLGRAHRFVELSQKHTMGTKTAGEVLSDLFVIENWDVTDQETRETAQLDMQLTLNKTQEILTEIEAKDSTLEPTEKLRRVAQLLRYQIATKEPFAKDDKSHVQITTLWGAKGVTADHIYVIGLCDEAIPGDRQNDYAGTENEFLEEQRRLFYVSITRAKQTMVLSRPKKIEGGMAKRMKLKVANPTWKYPELKRSRFLDEITTYLPDYVEGESWKGL